MTRSVARLAILFFLGMAAAPALAQPEHPTHASSRTPESARHHAARSQPDAAPMPPMPGLSSAQVLSGPLPMFPLPPASPFNAAPWTYVPHARISPFLRPRPSFVLGGFAFGTDAPFEAARAASPSRTPVTETPATETPRTVTPVTETPVAAPQPTLAQPGATPDRLYVIPGCYAGDRPPVDGMLPPGCDVTKLRIVRIR